MRIAGYTTVITITHRLYCNTNTVEKQIDRNVLTHQRTMYACARTYPYLLQVHSRAEQRTEVLQLKSFAVSSHQ